MHAKRCMRLKKFAQRPLNSTGDAISGQYFQACIGLGFERARSQGIKKQTYQRSSEKIVTGRGFLSAHIGMRHAVCPARWLVACGANSFSSFLSGVATLNQSLVWEGILAGCKRLGEPRGRENESVNLVLGSRANLVLGSCARNWLMALTICFVLV